VADEEGAPDLDRHPGPAQSARRGVANAIYNAFKKRVRELPITLDKLL
jgi:hypothetical protein